MDFYLNIATITKAIYDYRNKYNILEDQKGNVVSTVNWLTGIGWSGEAKDKFLEVFQAKMKLYEKLQEDIKYMINALEEEKQRALLLKTRSEDFVNCIERSGQGGPISGNDEGVISLDYNSKLKINNYINNCTNEDYVKLNSNFNNIENILNELEYTSFGISGEVDSAKTSVKDQTESLTEFDDSYNAYYTGVKDMESNICSVFSKISGVNGGLFKNSSIISASGDIDKNQLRDVMLRNKDGNNKLNESVEAKEGPTLEEAAEMAENVYFEDYDKAKNDELLGGWKLTDVNEVGSMRIGVYLRVGVDGEIEYTLVSRGSRSFSEYWDTDWKNNLQQPFGASADMKNSMKFARNFENDHLDANITFVGHSKGGAEAAANAVATNHNAILFNPSTVNLNVYGLDKSNYSSKMTSYIVKGEILNDLEGWMSEPIDNEVYLPSQYPVNGIRDVGNATQNHLMPAVKKAIKEAEEENNE